MSDCAEIRELLAEYAAGVLDGRDLSAVEEHLKSCARCRADADELIDVVDAVLGLAPDAEPALGFEARVMDRIDGVRSRQRVRRSLLAAAAALVVLVGAVGIGRITAPSSPKNLDEYALRTAAHQTVGWAWVHPGKPGWIYVDMSYERAYPRVSVEVVTDAGTTVSAGELALDDGHGTLGLRSPVPVAMVRTIQMRLPSGRLLCHATLDG